MRITRSVLASLVLAGLTSAVRCDISPTPAPTEFVNASTPAPTVLTSVPTPSPTQLALTPSPTPATTIPGATNIQAKIRSGEVRARSVNLGAWLVNEHWMSYESPLYTGIQDQAAVDRGEYAIMRQLGFNVGTAAFQKHRDYWINEGEVAAIAATGLNTVRVPVGFWIVCDDDSPSYEFGMKSGCVRDQSTAPSDSQINTYARGSLAYLDKLVNEWSVKHNVAVMLSLHAHQGSQNGYEHSAPVAINTIDWFLNDVNRDNSVNFATFLARRYASSPAFLGMNILNEPRMDPARCGSQDLLACEATQWGFLKDYYARVYRVVRGDGNNCVIAVSPMLQQQDAEHLHGLMDNGSYSNVWHELHSYYIWGLPENQEELVLQAVDNYAASTVIPASKNANNRLYVGEWCMGGPPNEKGIFKSKDNFRKLGRKQLEMLNQYPTGGWAFWSWRHSDDSDYASGPNGKPTGWSLRALIRSGDLALAL